LEFREYFPVSRLSIFSGFALGCSNYHVCFGRDPLSKPPINGGSAAGNNMNAREFLKDLWGAIPAPLLKKA